MGTSSSSSGSPSGVPLVPPWADKPQLPPAQPDTLPEPDSTDATDNEPQGDQTPSLPLAPPGRFRGTRVALGSYADSGSRTSLKQGVGRYIGTGLGGGSTAAKRLSGTAQTAGALYSVFSGTDHRGREPFDLTSVEGKSAREIGDIIVANIRPINGTQDAEASRRAVHDALSDLLTQYPDADLLNLEQDQTIFVLERYIALDVFNRFCLDVGKTIMDRAPSAATALERLDEVKNFISQIVAAAFRTALSHSQIVNGDDAENIAKDCLKTACIIFEDETG